MYDTMDVAMSQFVPKRKYEEVLQERDRECEKGVTLKEAVDLATASREALLGRMETLTRELGQQESDLQTWRSWVQFVFLGGGPVSLDDIGLRNTMVQRLDELQEMNARLKPPTQKKLVSKGRNPKRTAQVKKAKR